MRGKAARAVEDLIHNQVLVFALPVFGVWCLKPKLLNRFLLMQE